MWSVKLLFQRPHLWAPHWGLGFQYGFRGDTNIQFIAEDDNGWPKFNSWACWMFSGKIFPELLSTPQVPRDCLTYSLPLPTCLTEIKAPSLQGPCLSFSTISSGPGHCRHTISIGISERMKWVLQARSGNCAVGAQRPFPVPNDRLQKAMINLIFLGSWFLE